MVLKKVLKSGLIEIWKSLISKFDLSENGKSLISQLPINPTDDPTSEGSKHFFVDLVFYHRILKCHVLIELKLYEFNHEHLGQLNTYVNWYKKNVMTDGDNPPIGILLCSLKDHSLVEYALAGMDNSLFVSKYQLELPKKEEMQSFINAQMLEVEK